MKQFFVMIIALLLAACFITTSASAAKAHSVEIALDAESVASGDVNGDGTSNSIDAALVLKYDALIIDGSELNVNEGDVSGDGITNSIDAALILKYDAGLITDYRYAVPTMEFMSFTINSTQDSYTARYIHQSRDIVPLVIFPSTYNGLPVTKVSCIGSTIKIKEVYLPEGILEINSLSFYGNSYLEKINIPSSVLRINDKTFQNLPNLKTVDFYADKIMECKADFISLPKLFTTTYNGVKYLGNPDNRYLYALKGEWDLNEAVLHPDTKIVGDSAFLGTNSLEKVVTPEGLKVIGEHAFLGCQNITEVTLHEGLVAVMQGAFDQCEKVKISVPDSLMYVGINAFDSYTYNRYKGFDYVGNANNPYRVLIRNTIDEVDSPEVHPNTKIIAEMACSATFGTVNLPEGLLVIGERAFSGFDPIESDICIPSTVIFVGESAFEDCKIKNGIVLPKGLKFIGERAFCGTYIESVDVRCKLDYIPKEAFLNCTRLKNIGFPDGLRVICDSAFKVETGKGTVCLDEQLVLPEGLKYIGEYAFSGRRPFAVVAETPLNIPDSVEYIGFKAFGNESITFKYEHGYKYINIGSSLKTIPQHAFESCAIASIVIPDNITTIDGNAFSSCLFLEKVYLSKNLKILGEGAFSRCSDLTDIYYDGTKAEWGAIEKNVGVNGNAWNDYCREITVHCSDGDIIVPASPYGLWT